MRNEVYVILVALLVMVPFIELACWLGRPRYRDKLKDRRWAERKADYYEHHPRECVICGAPWVELHHIRYRGEPWDAPDEDLVPLCRRHHKQIHRRIL
jgi:hypothetical protein